MSVSVDHLCWHDGVIMYWYDAVVRRVIDGDTVVLDIDQGFDDWKHNQSIRLWKVSAPETRRGRWSKGLTREEIIEHLRRGRAAKERMQELLPVGLRVTLHTIKDRRSFTRYLGMIEYIDADDNWCNVGKVLVSEGHAVYGSREG